MDELQVNPRTGRTPDGRAWRQDETGRWTEAVDVVEQFRFAGAVGIGIMLAAIAVWMVAWAVVG